MRIITSYAYTLDAETAEEAALRFDIYRGVMDDWLHDQGISDPRVDSPPDTYVQLARRDISHEGAKIDGFLLKQPILESSHLLHTQFDLLVSDQSLALFLQFRVERRTNRIAPASIELNCPKALTAILATGHWQAGKVRVHPHHRRILGTEAGKQLRGEVRDPDRTLPTVLIANLGGPDWGHSMPTGPYSEVEWQAFARALEQEIGGVAQLIELDALASEAMDPDLDGVLAWIIWPLADDTFSPDRHPAWAPFDYYYEIDDDDGDDYDVHRGGTGTVPPEWIKLFRRHELLKLMPVIRDTIYDQAALQPAPELINDTRRQHATAERDRLAANNNFEEWQQLYEEEIEQKDQEISSQRHEVGKLEETISGMEDVANMQQAAINQLTFQLNQSSAIAKDLEHAEGTTLAVDPKTVAEAIDIADAECASLEFGPDALNTVRSLDPKAGPPSKILQDLRKLNECCEVLTQGALGQDVLKWLKKGGVTVAQESDTRKQKHRDKLTFKTNEGDAVLMSNHITYKGNSLNRQVRVYFRLRKVDPGKKQSFDIGYIGPKIAEE